MLTRSHCARAFMKYSAFCEEMPLVSARSCKITAASIKPALQLLIIKTTSSALCFPAVDFQTIKTRKPNGEIRRSC